MKLNIVIIGARSHGKTTLAKALEQILNVKCEIMNTQDLIEIKNEQQKKLEDLEKELILENKGFQISDKSKHRKKGKEIKPWQRTKFYQR